MADSTSVPKISLHPPMTRSKAGGAVPAHRNSFSAPGLAPQEQLRESAHLTEVSQKAGERPHAQLP
jgi:hypothetical protein